MNEYNYTISLAGIPFELKCRYAYEMLKEFRTGEKPNEIIAVKADSRSILQRYAAGREMESPQSAEYIQLIGEVGSALLKYKRCIFHGAAFIWHGKAWIFTAPSGTGKTTQYALWKLRYGEELSILNGDKPILEFSENGKIIVHPSPWRGKENMGTMCSAPLGGIILLRQGKENRVRELPPSMSALPLFLQFLFLIDKEENVDRVCALETELLKNCPVWELTNRGDEASAKLMHDTLLNWEKQ